MTRFEFLFLPMLAAQSGPDPLAGNFDLDPTRSEDPVAAIKRGTESMNFVARPIARSMLARRNVVPTQLAIAFEGGQVRIESGRSPKIPIPLDGPPIAWTHPDGEPMKVSCKRQGPILEQTFEAKDGKRLNRYQWDAASQRLLWRVQLTSPRLPQPIEYLLVFKRR